MEYVLYLAKADKGEPIVNITHNPWIDFTLLHEKYGIRNLNVLTPLMPISYVRYIMDSVDKVSPFRKIFMGSDRIGYTPKIKSIEESLTELGIKPLKKIKSIDYGEIPIPDEELEKICEVLKGRIMTYDKIKRFLDDRNIYYESSLMDILQTLYLKGKLNIFPSLCIERIGRKYICKVCEGEIEGNLSMMDNRCPSCGSYIELDEPLFAVPMDNCPRFQRVVKFKDYKEFTFPQNAASDELVEFIRESRRECFLWMVPGGENPNIFLRMIRNVLREGKNCGIASSFRDDSLKIYTSLKNGLSGVNVVFKDREKTGIGDVTLLGFEDIKDCYKAFDVVILWEAFNSTDKISQEYVNQAKRAIKDGGKIIFASFSPDYKMYQRILKKELKLITIPIRNHGRLMTEPRILKYRFFNNGQYFIPAEIVDFIKWSIDRGIRIHIIVPHERFIKPIMKKLMEIQDMDRGCFYGSNPRILVTEPFKDANVEEKENIIVLFADESQVFDERTLVNMAGIPGKFVDHRYGEVIFAGSRESNEMDLAKEMVRFINKMAWEKGYVK